MVILVLVTAVASAVLDNVTTVLLVAPVTFLVCDRLGVPVAPFLIAEVLASNIGGTATLVGDPPNIIIASRAGLSYNDFLVHLAPIVVVLLAVFVVLCRWLFRRAFAYDPERAAPVMALRERDAIRDRRLLVVSLAVLALVTGRVRAAHRPAPGAVGGRAWSAGSRCSPLSRLDAGEVARDVEWPTLVFFAGLFVMVGALVATGVDRRGLVAPPSTRSRAGCGSATMVLLWGSAVLSAIVDNIPYVATMSPIVADLVDANGGDDQRRCCGGRWRSAPTSAATPPPSAPRPTSSSSASPNAPADRISFWEFTKYGLVVTVVTVAAVRAVPVAALLRLRLSRASGISARRRGS